MYIGGCGMGYCGHGLQIRKIMVGNQEAIKIKISAAKSVIYNPFTEPAPITFSLPVGIYTLVKQ